MPGSHPTLYRWKQKYGGLTLDKEMLSEAIRPKL